MFLTEDEYKGMKAIFTPQLSLYKSKGYMFLMALYFAIDDVLNAFELSADQQIEFINRIKAELQEA